MPINVNTIKTFPTSASACSTLFKFPSGRIVESSGIKSQDWVMVDYFGKQDPGQVIHIDETRVSISTMQPSGPYQFSITYDFMALDYYMYLVKNGNTAILLQHTVKPVIERHGGLFFNLFALGAVYYRGRSNTGWQSIFRPYI